MEGNLNTGALPPENSWDEGRGMDGRGKGVGEVDVGTGLGRCGRL